MTFYSIHAQVARRIFDIFTDFRKTRESSNFLRQSKINEVLMQVCYHAMGSVKFGARKLNRRRALPRTYVLWIGAGRWGGGSTANTNA